MRESLLGRLQPIPAIIVVLAFDNMKGIDEPALPTQIPLTLMQQIAVYEYQSPCFNLTQFIFIFLVPLWLFDLQICWELRP